MPETQSLPQSNEPVTASTLPTYKLNSRRNFLAFSIDMLSFATGIAFIPATIVLVGLASHLTSDKTLLGVVAMTGSVAWFLPQIVAARIVHGKRHQKGYLVGASLIGRQAYLVMAIWLLVTQAQSPLLTVWLLIACIATFHMCDSLAGVAWFDMLSRALSPRVRARSVTIGNLIGLVGGIGSGVVVERVLSPAGLPFPTNYAVILLCAWAFFIISFVAILFIQETPMSATEHSQVAESHFIQDLREALRTDKTFQRLIIARLFTGIEAIAIAFYVIFLRERLQVSDATLGLLTIASVVGGIVGIVFFGWLGNRFGSRWVIWLSVMLQVMSPVLALAVAAFPAITQANPALGLYFFMAAFGIDNAVGQAGMLGFQSYPLDAAPERHRAMYIGVLNSVGGVVSLTPVLGGLLLDSLSSVTGSMAAYSIVFGIAAASVLIGLVFSLSLPKPTRAG
jgi:MFS family permease